MKTSDMVRMANQIAGFFRAYGHDEAVAEIAGHLRHFWEPRMRRQLLASIAAGERRYDPLVLDAAAHLKEGTGIAA